MSATNTCKDCGRDISPLADRCRRCHMSRVGRARLLKIRLAARSAQTASQRNASTHKELV